MHDSVLKWVEQALSAEDVAGRRVLEVGAYDVNGSVRPVVERLEPSEYAGVDQAPGPGVDVICDAADLASVLDRSAFDVVISTEMLEHVVDWRPVMTAMVNVLAPGGLLVLTTRSPGFPYHPYPIDTWRYTRETMGQILGACGLYVRELVDDPQVAGVFAIAVKPADWVAPWDLGDLDLIEVQAMVAPDE